jgi:hypothetical protein
MLSWICGHAIAEQHEETADNYTNRSNARQILLTYYAPQYILIAGIPTS